MFHNYVEVFLFLVVVLLAAKAAGWASTRIGQPAVLGEILIGLLLGPTLIVIARQPMFPESREQIVAFDRQQSAVEEIAKADRATGAAGNDKSDEESEQEALSKIVNRTHDAVINAPELGATSESGREEIAQAATGGLQTILLDRKSFLEEAIKILAEIGVLFLMFMAGLETDLAMMKRVGKAAFMAAAGGVIVPFAFGTTVAVLMVPHLGIYPAIFTGAILCATSVSISAQTLKELGALKSKEGTCILGAAVIDDVMGIIVLSLVIAFNPIKLGGTTSHAKMYEVLSNWVSHLMGLDAQVSGLVGIAILILCMTLFFVIFYLFGAFYFEKILSWASRMPVSEPKLAFAIGLGLLFAWAAEYIGAVAAITGTYLAGVIMGQTSHRHEITEKLGIITYGFFVPIFFINIGLEANARELGGEMLWFTIVVCIAAVVGKIIGSLAGARMGGFSPVESLRVGIGMVSRGEVGLIVASVGLSAGIIDKQIFSVMVIMVLFTTLVTPVLLRFVFPRTGGPVHTGPSGGG